MKTEMLGLIDCITPQLAAVEKRFLAELKSGRMSARTVVSRLCDMAWLSLRSHHLTFDWRDPLPTLHMFWRQYLENPLRRRLPIARPLPR